MDRTGKTRRALKLNHKGQRPKDQLQTKLAQILEDIKTEKRVCVKLKRQSRLESLMWEGVEGEVSIRPLYLPGRLRAGSMASGLLVVAITRTAFLSLPSVDGKG